jgi:hypothetical protein
MTDEPYAEPELRAALATLLVAEPNTPPVVDDVARGRARRRRRTVAASGVVALVASAVVLGGTALGDRAQNPQAPTGAAAGPSVEDAAAGMADRLGPVLATMGRTMVEATATAGAEGTEIRLTLARTDDPTALSALWILGAGVDAARPVTYLARCTDVTCPGERTMTIADGVTPTGGYDERGATSLTLDPPGSGARMLDRSYRTGSLVEVVAVPLRDAAGSSGRSLLTFGQLGRIITAIGDPLRPGPRPTTSTSPSVPVGLRGVAAATAACPELPDRDIDAEAAITGDVRRLWVCSTATYEPIPARRLPAQVVGPRAGKDFDTFLRELARPDGPPAVEGTACRAMIQLPRSLVVETSDGSWLAHVPRDSCGHFSPELVDALDRATR